MKNAEIGSYWRKWDLQIHTPESHLNNQFGSNFDEFARTLFAKIIESDIWAVGVTDYYTVEGYKKLLEILNDDIKLQSLCNDDKETVARIKQTAFFPNIEFRIESFVEKAKVNLHVLFSDKVDVKHIEENFLWDLEFSNQAQPQTGATRPKLKVNNLAELGQKLKDQHPQFKSKSDIAVGMENVGVSHESITKLLNKRKDLFGGKFLIALPPDEDLSKIDWNSQGHLTRKILSQKVDFFFTGSPETRRWALGLKSQSVQEYIQEFGSIRPCLNSSDAHKIEELFQPAQDRYTWIKADLTFEGLRQVMNEPDRVFIGKSPPIFNRLESNPTQFIKSLSIKKVNDSNFDEIWFDKINIDFNPELVAIIGNKGSGKSALADILGLCGDCSSYLRPYFSFLNDKKFCSKKGVNRATHFEAQLRWQDGSANDFINLSNLLGDENAERIKYIPQSYLEKICSDIGSTSETGFKQELEKAIFSGLNSSQNYGLASLEEILSFRTKEIIKKIQTLRLELSNNINILVETETKADPTFKKNLTKNLVDKKRLLSSLVENAPKEVPKPEETLETKTCFIQIQKQQDELKALKTRQIDLLNKRDKILKKSALLNNLDTSLSSLKEYFNYTSKEIEKYCIEIGIDFTNLVILKIDNQQIKTLQVKSVEDINQIQLDLEGSGPQSVSTLLIEKEKEITLLKEQLEGPDRAYQEYIKKVEEYEQKKKELLGEEKTPDTISYLEKELQKLDTINDKLHSETEKCIEISLLIYDEIGNLKAVYEELHSPIQKSINKHSLIDNNLTFAVDINPKDFESNFLNFLNQRKKGSFAGTEDGTLKLRKIIDEVDFNFKEQVRTFLRNILNDLRWKNDEDKCAYLTVQGQLKDRSVTLEQFYKFIFELSYLNPEYSLTWLGKKVEQLSPGERGTLLLIFFLLIDQSTNPLLIDQPEENLDNQTVYGVLVSAIKETKSRRQIFLVTHNPNLAVVCDAEQVIYANIEKYSNQVSYVSGAIENPKINNLVIDVLEGTRPAFTNRGSKYKLFRQ